jgi:hypothetical protein
MTACGQSDGGGDDMECSSVSGNTVSGAVYDCEGYRLPTAPAAARPALVEADLQRLAPDRRVAVDRTLEQRREHHRGRGWRFKVRVRSHLDRELSVLEVSVSARQEALCQLR